MEIFSYILEPVVIVLSIVIPMLILDVIWYITCQIIAIYRNKPTMRYIAWNKYMADKMAAEDYKFEE
mgnify:CR=1 FL=1